MCGECGPGGKCLCFPLRRWSCGMREKRIAPEEQRIAMAVSPEGTSSHARDHERESNARKDISMMPRNRRHSRTSSSTHVVAVR
jgi:hypothetical protein